jgi:hypothetical protein
MDLDGIAAAQRNMWTVLTGKVREFAPYAASAIRSLSFRRKLGTIGPPDIFSEQRAPH